MFLGAYSGRTSYADGTSCKFRGVYRTILLASCASLTPSIRLLDEVASRLVADGLALRGLDLGGL